MPSVRTRLSARKTFYIILGILFIFSLHQNGVFDAAERFVIPEFDQYGNDEVYLRNSDDFRYSIQGKSQSCKPKEKIVFLKTHKTASSTAAAIIERYGFNRNFTFAVSNTALKFYHAPLFTRHMVHEASDSAIGWKKADGYDMITNHARFNKDEMDAVVHNATYITIVRNPVDQLESAFGYFNLGLAMGFKKKHLEEFLKDPEKHFGVVKKGYWQFAKNNQLFDLGLDHKYHKDPEVVVETISKLDHDFHLVMVSEYFDESMILLRRLLCWDIDDVIYISKAIRSASHRLEINDDLRQKILDWNKADMQLYHHFNNTLWRKIKEYGPTFQRDLDYFRSRLVAVAEECIDLSRKDTRDTREVKFVLKEGAPHYCQELLWGDVEYTRFIQRRMWDRGILLPNPRVHG